MRSKNQYKIVSISFFIAILLSSCSTEKDAALNVGYHNMTARYNGYFNAKVIINESLESFRESATEDYTKLLPLELYPSKEDLPSIQENYETAFLKCEKVILRHSMPNTENSKNKNIEHCRWIDDNWFEIGVIHYTKLEYNKAEEIFKFIQESPLYTDQKRVHEARIWLAKTYIAQENYPEAKRFLSTSKISIESIDNEKKEWKSMSSAKKKRRKQQEKKDKKKGVKKPVPFPENLKDDYELTMAEFHIAQEEYKKAIKHLNKGIELTKNRKKKARYNYVLAQLYQKTGNGTMAALKFDEVVSSAAPYEMRFQAQINKAISATTGNEAILKELAKMIRDPKNIEYKDQIYYALAEIAIKEGDIEKAKKNYTSSALYSINNNRQKGISYLKLGNITFDEKDYLSAQKYYDSCVQALPQEYEEYEKIKAKAEGLSDLVVHYETYMHEDSVQRIAKMPSEELEKYLKKQLKQMKEDEERRKIEEQKRLIAQQNRVKNSGTNSGTGSKWYFYNQKVSSSGFNDFRAEWGQRISEDNWRRANKTSYSTEESDFSDEKDSIQNKEDPYTVENLMSGLPLSETDLDSSNHKLMHSLYMLGIIYKEQLKEEEEAIKYFRKVVDRKIEHQKVLPSLYQLYLIYTKKSSGQANEYKEKIVKEYPESEIAKIINDPEYLKRKREKELEDLNEYSATLENYKYRRYNDVLVKCNQQIAYDSTNEYINKYYLLKAFAIGKTAAGNKEAIASPLKKLYTLSPDSDEGKQAKIYLDKLEAGFTIVKPDTIEVSKSPYTYDENLEHYFVLVFPSSKGRINSTQNKLSNFNREFFRSKRLQITTAQMGTENQLLVVRKFPNQKTAEQYELTFNSNQSRTSLGSMANDFQSFLINSTNFPILFKSMDLKSYTNFFEDKYSR